MSQLILLITIAVLSGGHASPVLLSRDNEVRGPASWKSRSNSSGVLVEGDCAFRVNGDLNDTAPLFTAHNSFDWLLPNSDGVVFLRNGEAFDMYCGRSSFAAPFVNVTRITAQCLQRQYFLVRGLIYPFSQFRCASWPAYTARRTGRRCNGGTDLLQIGFEVYDGGFLPVMDVCHDEYSEVTRYVHHVLHPTSVHYQHSVGRPRFTTGGFFDGKNVDLMYTRRKQNETFSALLQLDASTKYLNPSFLTRGHLAAKSDFVFGAMQRATFLFVNVAPQWNDFNAGNWERVETGVRKYVADKKLTTDCYTGTWGISSLYDVDGNPQSLYLHFDENNNGLIPVPKLYFRVIIDRASRKGIVFLGVNNPHATREQILREYVICPDIGDDIDWIPWAKESLKDGYSYACAVPDFIAVVDHLPIELLNTTGILGIEEEETSNRTSTTDTKTASSYPGTGSTTKNRSTTSSTVSISNITDATIDITTDGTTIDINSHLTSELSTSIHPTDATDGPFIATDPTITDTTLAEPSSSLITTFTTTENWREIEDLPSEIDYNSSIADYKQ